MISHRNRYIAAPLLALLIFTQLGVDSCKKSPGDPPGFSFVTGLRLALVASPIFLDSLNLGEHRAAVAKDFTTLGSNTIDFGEALKACKDNPCRIEAVNSYQTAFWNVLRGGHFKLNAKLQTVQRVLQGIIDSARVFFGGPAPSAGNAPAQVVTESDLKAQLKALEAAMSP